MTVNSRGWEADASRDLASIPLERKPWRVRPGVGIFGLRPRDALALIERLSPDVAVLDLDMPVMDGLTALRALVAMQSPTRVLILTMHDGTEFLARARPSTAGTECSTKR